MDSHSSDVTASAEDGSSWLVAALTSDEAPSDNKEGKIGDIAKGETHARLKTVPLQAVVSAIESVGSSIIPEAELSLYRNWIAANSPDSDLLYAAWFNLGVLLVRQADHAAAFVAYDNAKRLNPNFYPAVFNLELARRALSQRTSLLPSSTGVAHGEGVGSPFHVTPSTLADPSAWLAALLNTYALQSVLLVTPAATQDETAGQADIQDCLRTIGFQSIILAIDRAQPGLANRVEIRLYQDWITANPGAGTMLYAAWFNLGVVLARADDHLGAVAAYSRVLQIKPDFYPAAVNLGLTYDALGRKKEALQTWQEATQSDEARKALLAQQARLMEEMGQLDKAEALLLTILLMDPAQPDAVQHWVHIRQKTCQWPVLRTDIPGLSPEAQQRLCGPLGVLALSDNIDLQRDVTANWIERKLPQASHRLAPTGGYHHDRIRIGYLSSDFCRHAMSFLIAELFEQHDRTRFEVFGYCSTLEDGSDIRRRVVAGFDHHRVIRDLTDEQAARLIRNDEIDILIDLNGLTARSRLAVMRWRPAPIQATYLGFIGPVPLPELDFLLCDDFVVPPGDRASYQPAPLPIARMYQANDSKRKIGNPLSRKDVSLPDDRFVLCCFSNHYKITEAMFGAWMSILLRADQAILWLAADNPWSHANLRSAAARAGVDPDRILFAERTSPERYMSQLRLADLFLDTFPYNAGTIASDAIRMQLPLLTLSGRSFASRMAGSLLNSIGAPDCATTTSFDYVETAVTLATDRQAYAAFKQRFSGDAWANTVGDTARFATEFELTLERLFQQGRVPHAMA